MRFLVDNNLSQRLGGLLVEAGHEAEHVRRLGLAAASDAVVLDLARSTGAVLISADTDFGALLAGSGATTPSVVLFRSLGRRRAEDQAAVLLDHLDAVAEELEAGAIVVIEDDRLRVRLLPVLPHSG